MNTRYSMGLIAAVVTGLSVVGIGSAMAQSYLDGSAKARGDYGQTSHSQTSPMYRYSTPTQRTFSYEPAPSTAQPAQPAGGCGSGTASSGTSAANNPPAAPQGGVAQRGTQTNRSYSYEPGTSSGTMRSSRSNAAPLWALPKSDSRKFGGQ
ncbi:MAG TPA: hypothetical protein VGJ04_09105 [Pirellulales bacterium]